MLLLFIFMFFHIKWEYFSLIKISYRLIRSTCVKCDKFDRSSHWYPYIKSRRILKKSVHEFLIGCSTNIYCYESGITAKKIHTNPAWMNKNCLRTFFYALLADLFIVCQLDKYFVESLFGSFMWWGSSSDDIPFRWLHTSIHSNGPDFRSI